MKSASSAPLQLVIVLAAGVILAAAIATLQLSLTVGASLALGFLVLFLARPMLGLLLVLLLRASTDLGFTYLTVLGAGGEVVGGLPNIGLILVLVFAGGAYILSRSVPVLSLPGGRLFALLLILGLVGVARADDPFFSMNEWVPVLASLVIYALAAHFFIGPRRMQLAVDVVATSFILPAALGVYQLIAREGVISPDFPIPRIIGTFLHPNVFGFYLVFIIALFLGQALFQAGPRKILSMVGLCVAFVLLFGTYSRTSWVGAIVVLLTVGMLRARSLLPLLPLGVLVGFGALPSIRERLADVLAGGGSFADRVYRLWPETVHAWLTATGADRGGLLVLLDRMTGLGAGIGPALSRYGLAEVPHNDYLRVLVEYGVFGVMLFLALNAVLILTALRMWRTLGRGDRRIAAVVLSFSAVAVAFPIISISDNLFAHTVTQVYFWMLAGLAMAAGIESGCLTGVSLWRSQFVEEGSVKNPAYATPNGRGSRGPLAGL